jgi:hypothetical protein
MFSSRRFTSHLGLSLYILYNTAVHVVDSTYNQITTLLDSSIGSTLFSLEVQ